jgi:glyoxylase-like metal-dependent hydrolase (beta-lactamase superfamily II)
MVRPTMLPENPEKVRGLSYPYGMQAAPQPGEPIEIADGVFWLRFPMPMALDHINLWLLRDGEAWTVVDTCLDLPTSRALWEQLFHGFLRRRPIGRVICTHLHPDHVGLAGWLTRQFDGELWMSREEFLMCRLLTGDTGREAPEQAIRFYRAAGFTEAQLDAYRRRFGEFGAAISALPDSYRRLVDGETIQIDGRYWQVVVGSGHSTEHVCLYCPALKLLISGDQVLPRISSNVSVFPTEPKGDPLTEWLDSNARLRRNLPDDVLVLPAHQEPFYGLHVRLSQLIESHERNLDRLFDHLDEPRRGVDCFPALFQREITDDLLQMAAGETLAHLNCLLGRRMLIKRRDTQGVDWYQRKAETAECD